MLLLDTDVMIDLQRAYPPAVAWYGALSEQLALPGLVVMEMIQLARNKKQVLKALKFVSKFPVIWPTEADCQSALANFSVHHVSHRLGLLDSLIAACATGVSATLCTFNLKHFKVIPQLVTLQPYAKKKPSGKIP